MARQYVLKSRSTPASRIDYAAELNEQQLEAVTAPPGPMLVIAGAGSGKTRTLTYRVAYLLEHGMQPSDLLLLTFTNKAAKEMLGRVENLLPNSTAGLWGGTFHSVGNRILRRHAEVIGYRRGFSIMDRADQKDLLDAVIAELRPPKPALKAGADDFPKSTVVADIFSYAINTGRRVTDVVETRYPQHTLLAESFEAIFDAYEKRKLQANVMDFDDLLAKALRLLKDNPGIAAEYQLRFKCVLVDEYQDTNRIQSEFIDELAAKHKNVMVVGDDAQAIYSWRGANFQNILNFPQTYAGARQVKIETNYRSRPAILELANDAIALNQKQFRKELRAAREDDEVKPALVPLRDNHQQAQFIVERIQDLVAEGTPLREIAVLYRAHFHSMELEMELIRAQIPYTLTSGLRFFEQAHIKDILAFLKFLNNPTDEVSFMRMALLGEGIGKRGAFVFWQTLAQDLPAPGTYPMWGEVFGKIKTSAKSAKAWDQLAEALDMAQGTEQKPLMPSDQLAMVLNCFYEHYAHQKYPDAGTRLEDITQLIRFASEYEDLETFLAELALLGSTDDQPDQEAKEMYSEGGSLTLSSVHQAKGLEWAHVFVIWLAEGSFPSHRSVETADALEEERRLFYVAVTRAKDALYLTYPRMRLGKGGSYGYGNDTFQVPSRFLEEVSPRLLEEWEVSSGW